MGGFSRKRQIYYQAQNQLNKMLCEPKRKAQELQFAQEHALDSDEALYTYVEEMKRRLGKRMTPASTVGYVYLVERLGPWAGLMTRVNQKIEADHTSQLEQDLR